MILWVRVCAMAVAVVALGACATAPSEVTLNKMHDRERIYIGRFKVTLNDKPAPRCEIYVNYDIGPVLTLPADSTGFMAYRTDRDHPRFSRLICLHEKSRMVSAWHMQSLNLEKLTRPDDNHKIVYFGDVVINWTIDPAQTEEAARNEEPDPSGRRTGHIKDSGELKLKIESHKPEAEAEWMKMHPDSQQMGFSIDEVLVKKED